jgi:hypothetical protein
MMKLTPKQTATLTAAINRVARVTAPLRKVFVEADRTIAAAERQLADEDTNVRMLGNQLHEHETGDPDSHAFSRTQEVLVLTAVVAVDFVLNMIACEALLWNRWRTYALAAGFTLLQAILVYFLAVEIRARRLQNAKAEVNA